jgi:riboflavin biosynthesis pyrimidine reductase
MRSVITSANLIVGKDGSTTLNGSSMGLSTDEDRRRFHNLRSRNDLILIGGNTARREPYQRTPIPLYIITHSKLRLQPKNNLVKQFSMEAAQLIAEIRATFNSEQITPIKVLVEAGPTLLMEMISQGLVDNLYLTINRERTGEQPIDIRDLTKDFKLISREQVESCNFLLYEKLTN